MIQFKTFSQTRPLFEYLKKKRQNQKFIQTVELTATFLLISFFLLFAIRPTVFTISSLLGDIKSKEILSKQQLKPKINQIIQAQDAFVQIQQDYHLIESSFPDDPAYSDVVTQVLGASQQSQIPVNRVSFLFSSNTKTNNKTSPVESYNITFGQNTQFSQVVAFVNQLMQNRRLMDISKISFNKGSSASPDTVSFTITANVLYWQQNNEKK